METKIGSDFPGFTVIQHKKKPKENKITNDNQQINNSLKSHKIISQLFCPVSDKELRNTQSSTEYVLYPKFLT